MSGLPPSALFDPLEDVLVRRGGPYLGAKTTHITSQFCRLEIPYPYSYPSRCVLSWSSVALELCPPINSTN